MKQSTSGSSSTVTSRMMAATAADADQPEAVLAAAAAQVQVQETIHFYDPSFWKSFFSLSLSLSFYRELEMVGGLVPGPQGLLLLLLPLPLPSLFSRGKKRSRQTDIHSFTRVSRSGHLAWIFSLLFLLHRHSFKCRRHFSTMEVAPSQASTFSPNLLSVLREGRTQFTLYFCDKDRHTHTHTHTPSFSLQKWACNNDLFFFSLY